MSVCLLCITEVIRRQNICPMDRHPLDVTSLLELPPDVKDEVDTDATVTPPTKSAKISELVRYLKAFDKNDKTLVFSQFTSFLDRVAAVLHEEGINFCRFDGSMNAKKVDLLLRELTSASRSDCKLPNSYQQGEQEDESGRHADLAQVRGSRSQLDSSKQCLPRKLTYLGMLTSV